MEEIAVSKYNKSTEIMLSYAQNSYTIKYATELGPDLNTIVKSLDTPVSAYWAAYEISPEYRLDDTSSKCIKDEDSGLLNT